MSIRILQLINNFYCDNGLKKGKNREVPLGKYCVLGYFDALDVNLPSDVFQEGDKTWNVLSALSAQKHDRAVSRRNIVCVPGNELRDQQFWEEESALPFYFVSMLRVNKEKYSALQMISDVQEMEKKDQNIVTYYTYNHSEVVIVKKTGNYREGMKYVISLRDRFSAFKVYSIFAIREQALTSRETIAGEIEDEQIDCRLHCVVKDYKGAEIFWNVLNDTLTGHEGRKVKAKRYDTLGSYDWMIEINNISIQSMLSCYKMGEILTHTNPVFEKAFFNIETEILLPGKGPGENGTMDY